MLMTVAANVPSRLGLGFLMLPLVWLIYQHKRV
ncbi:hypothetical protein Pan216_57970 [Planctomycetes bacterium Pan216]|uniref:Uncharacterized protein n=1 Tax=Kolteria novifilia TaxID=2527975 RepID=A0A518BDD6_9BACT|nr:hypothetical protein Pan216_57970 [Planctomycetes bacterium Pan216]